MLLILDLDETLIHATDKALGRVPDFQVYYYDIYKRPYLDEFLKTVSQHFKLAVWSSADDEYVGKIVKEIFPDDINLEFVWGRSRCTRQTLYDEYGFPYYSTSGFLDFEYTKQLKKLKKKGFDLKKVLIVDDTPKKVANSYGNAIYIKEYNGEEGDIELKFLAQYLLTLKTEENVRTIEKRYWRQQYQI
jgi:RNA polymerase II subunit A small phosphatase-like protein